MLIFAESKIKIKEQGLKMVTIWLIIFYTILENMFQYMAVSDNKQSYMSLPDDRLPKRCKELAYLETVLIDKPIELEFI